MARNKKEVPVFLLNGFLESGKTSLILTLNKLLNNGVNLVEIIINFIYILSSFHIKNK